MVHSEASEIVFEGGKLWWCVVVNIRLSRPTVPVLASVFVYENINLPTLKNIIPFSCVLDAPIQSPIRL